MAVLRARFQGVSAAERSISARDELLSKLREKSRDGTPQKLFAYSAYYFAISVANAEQSRESLGKLCDVCECIPTEYFRELATNGELHAVYEVAICCLNEELFSRAWECRGLDPGLSASDEKIYSELSRIMFRGIDADIELGRGVWVSRLALKIFSLLLDRFVVFQDSEPDRFIE